MLSARSAAGLYACGPPAVAQPRRTDADRTTARREFGDIYLPGVAVCPAGRMRRVEKLWTIRHPTRVQLDDAIQPPILLAASEPRRETDSRRGTMKKRTRILVILGTVLVVPLVALAFVPILFRDRIVARVKAEVNQAIEARVDW